MADVAKKGAAWRVMEFIKMLIIGNLILLLIVLPCLLLYNFVAPPNKTFQYMLLGGMYVFTAILVAIYYCFWAGRYNLFIAPTVFVTFPFVLYFAMTQVRLFIKIQSCPAGWEIWAVILAIIYSLPFFAITMVASVLKKQGVF